MAGASFIVRQYRDAIFQRLAIEENAFFVIRSGSKIVTDEHGNEHRASAGDFVYLRQGDVLTIRNIPESAQPYLAEGISFSAALIAEHRGEFSSTPNPSQPHRFCLPADVRLMGALETAKNALQDPSLPASICRLRLREVLSWLDMFGIGHGAPEIPSISSRLRRLIAADPGQPWRAPAVAAKLGMSEATLRRALSRESSSFSNLLSEIRLSRALARIQSSNDSLIEIAIETGYASPSHFSQAFRERFGIQPKSLRKSTI